MPVLSNPRQEAFAQLYVETGNASEAWRRVTGKTGNADVNAFKWLGRPEVKARIAEIQAENDRLCQLKRDEALAFLATVVRTPLGKVDRDSPLCQEHTKTDSEHSSTERIKMPGKLEALRLVGQWCGWETGTQAENKMTDSLIAGIRRITHESQR